MQVYPFSILLALHIYISLPDLTFFHIAVGLFSLSTITQWMCHCIIFIFFWASAVTTAAYASQLLMQLKGPGLTAPDCKYASMR